ncbi:putative carboxylesterase [Aspergillus ruber CBS 135680]|uniref:Carboxylic ester hydrolase n=1 Tax=Aspergillus ruber (strain CBS 135680) TaxID=1388766 RepID=A0A017S4V7_ASPRC|nr:alpha/beta-hydrolase [Aspergillus ruber CBS 135680]EYE92028.1 alpha/beta-hydrolase [Aspergillus ruber CBS 135680]
MALPQIHHSSLQTTFTGTSQTNDGTTVNSFRGIPYATIPARFERSQLMQKFDEPAVDATRYGPRCPQMKIDVRHLLRIPEDIEIPEEDEDEFKCLNLEITCPPLHQSKGPLPVLIWIHGGSQVVTFCSAASGICDPTKLVADSIKYQKPMVFVSINYRLNIFAFGDGKEMNLALKDQRLGIEWVRKNIASFGGDPNNITLAGESAGGVYAHAHLVTGPPVKRAILASGSLYLSRPMPAARGKWMVNTLEAKVKELGQSSLREATVPILIQALGECNVNSMFLQEDSELQDWESRPEHVEEVMIGDTEYESVIWRNGIETHDVSTINAAFNLNPEWGPQLRKMYQVVPTRPTASKLGALDIIDDALYAMPVEVISDKLQANQKTAYKYVVDQPNPWQSSSRSHHAVDLLFLFGTMDLSHNPGAEGVGQDMRRRWASFVNGDAPWPEQKRYAYGPFGVCGEIDEGQFAGRRRIGHIKALREAGKDVFLPIVFALAAGKISLLN